MPERLAPAPLPTPPEQPKLTQPVPLWEHGKIAREIEGTVATQQGYMLLDLGESWTPYLFTDGFTNDGKPAPSAYRPIYLALARGEYPDNYHGDRAKDDKYLELFGILPTLNLVRKRMEVTAQSHCDATLDLKPLQDFAGLVTYESNAAAQKRSEDFLYLKRRVHQLMEKQHVDEPAAIDREPLAQRDKDVVARYMQKAPEWFAIDAMQQRFKCEGYYKTRGNKFVRGGMDWATHDSLAEFERRYRVFSFGYMGKESMSVLRVPPMQAEYDAVLRVLVERAAHTAGVIEDGSTSTLANGSPRTWKGADGNEHQVRDIVSELREAIIDAFGLRTPESTLAWLHGLGKLPNDEHRFVAIAIKPLPEYYNGDMQLTLDYDRGDVWYDFPYGDHGEELQQPVQRRPQVTVSALYGDQKIPLARYGTTIGGWRTENVDGVLMWKYKGSPVGPRAWEEIVASPVWLPPDDTPPKDLLKRNSRKKTADDPDYVVNFHEVGPSYASAYGLVAAYHRTYFKTASGRTILGNDEGIRTHGSVDYMSIMRRHSHGCHRLHNHIALRLMSFVLAHRPHQRLGHEQIAFHREIPYENKQYVIELKQGGYVFKLDQPLFVNVEEGRIRGQAQNPIEIAIPKYNEEVGAYITPEGTAVQVRNRALVPIPMPTLPDGGVPNVMIPSANGAPRAPVAAPPPSAPLTGMLTETVPRPVVAGAAGPRSPLPVVPPR